MLNAGIAELVERGLTGASMESIAGRAAVSKRTLYKHFPSIEAVFEAVLELLVAQVEPLGRLRFDSSRPFAAQLQEIAEREMQLICDASFIGLSRVLMIECMHSQERSAQLATRFQEKELGLYRWFGDAHAAGMLGDMSPQLAADLFVGMLKSCTYWHAVIGWQAPPDAATQAKLIGEACAMLLARLGDPHAD